jgi:hypothetical protein
MIEQGKIYFEYQFDSRSPKVSMELQPESTLTEVLAAFEEFLLGCGYKFKDSEHVVLLDDEELAADIEALNQAREYVDEGVEE